MKLRLLFDECPEIQNILHKYETVWKAHENYYIDSHETRYILDDVSLTEALFVKIIWGYDRNVASWTYEQIRYFTLDT